MHVRVPCSPWGMTSISTSRLLEPSKHHPSGLFIWPTLPSFISKVGDRCCDGCDDGWFQPWGLTLASNNFTLIHHYHRRRRCSESFTEPLTWQRPLELSGWPLLSAGWSSHKPTLENFCIDKLLKLYQCSKPTTSTAQHCCYLSTHWVCPVTSAWPTSLSSPTTPHHSVHVCENTTLGIMGDHVRRCDESPVLI